MSSQKPDMEFSGMVPQSNTPDGANNPLLPTHSSKTFLSEDLAGGGRMRNMSSVSTTLFAAAKFRLNARRSSMGSLSASTTMSKQQIEVAAYWFDVMKRYGSISEDEGLHAAQVIAAANIPLPSNDANSYLTHEFLRDIGVYQPALRAKIKLAVHRMPDVDFSQYFQSSAEKSWQQERGGLRRDPSVAFDKSPMLEPGAATTYKKDTTQVSYRTFEANSRDFVWFDLSGKTAEVCPTFDKYLSDLHQDLGIEDDDDSIIRSSLEQTLPMPQIVVDPEIPSRCVFVLRVCTLDVEQEDDSVRELTNRWTVYVDVAKQYVATVHRVDSPALAAVRDTWRTHMRSIKFKGFIETIMSRFLKEYAKALDWCDAWLDSCEETMLSHTQTNDVLRGLFHLQRRASVYDRMVHLTETLVLSSLGKHLKMNEELRGISTQFTALKERCSDLQARAQNLLEIHLSLTGYHTNELMKVLTKFSMFFTPITFIAGVYGMNFDNMPELRWQNGYFYCLGLMVAVVLVVVVYFGRNSGFS